MAESICSGVSSDKIDDIKEKTANLSSIMMKLGEAAYKDNTENKKPNDSNSDEKINDKEKEDVVDADFEEVKSEDDKKNAS